MKKVASFLVEKRKILLCLFLVLAAVSLPLMGQVRIHYDLSKYLSAESRMKQGMQLMEQEFGPSDSSQLRVMIPDLSASEKEEILHDLSALAADAHVTWEPGNRYNHDRYTLYEITTEYDSHSKEAAALFRAVHDLYDSRAVATG